MSEKDFTPRDLDLVVGDISRLEFEFIFRPFCVGVTRFGGYKLIIDGCRVDVWRIEDTWAFAVKSDWEPCFENLPFTTFLNIEAIVAEMTSDGSIILYDEGFSWAVKTGVLDINFESNPFPGLCVVKSMVVAQRMHMRIGQRLAKYLVVHGRRFPLWRLQYMQERHYGKRFLSDSMIEDSIEKLRLALHQPRWVPVRLFSYP